MNPPPNKKKLLDEVLGAPPEGASDLPEFLTRAIRQRRRRRFMQRASAVAGVSIAIVGLGFVAFHRTHGPAGSANKGIAKASIHETVTTAPKVRTRKFQAEVVKTKDHKILPKESAHTQVAVEIVTTQPWRSKPLVDSASDIPGVDSMSDLSSLIAGQVLIATVATESTDLDLAGGEEPNSFQLSYITTTRGNYHVLDDEALLASLAPRAVMLARDAAGEEHLVFLNPKDEKDRPLG